MEGRKKVFVTREIPEPGIQMLERYFDVDVWKEDDVIPRRTFLQKIVGVDAILCLLTEKIDDEVFRVAGPQLKIVSNYAVGFDNFDLKALEKHGVVGTNTPGVPTEAVAEHTVGLILACARHIPKGDRFMRAGRYRHWEPTLMLGLELKDKILGIIGLGRIGSRVAEIMQKGVGMRILYHDIARNHAFERAVRAQFRSLDQLLRAADIITLHTPLTPQTKHLINKSAIEKIKPSAIVINTARGPIVEEHALYHAVMHKRIAGAAIDVFEDEPDFAKNHRDRMEALQSPDLVMTPHIASATIEARSEMARLAAENIINVLHGQKPISAVERTK